MKKPKDGKGESGKEDDEKLWDFVIRSVTPLSSKEAHQQRRIRKEATDLKKKTTAPPPPRFTQKTGPDVDFKPDFGLKPSLLAATPRAAPATDRRTAARLRRGDIRVEAVLDLHGLHQAPAQARLFQFLQESFVTGRRCILVITGKGAVAEGGGVLRRAFPVWLALPAVAEIILDYAPAQPRDGGGGAFYVLLRRQR